MFYYMTAEENSHLHDNKTMNCYILKCHILRNDITRYDIYGKHFIPPINFNSTNCVVMINE